jgi:hypothetical protein
MSLQVKADADVLKFLGAPAGEGVWFVTGA